MHALAAAAPQRAQAAVAALFFLSSVGWGLSATTQTLILALFFLSSVGWGLSVPDRVLEAGAVVMLEAGAVVMLVCITPGN